jgi:hypothetical protein
LAVEYNVFISWSGDRSRMVAAALREWLPRVIQASKPWMSETDIEKGTRGDEQITRAVGSIKLGIVCLTPENLDAPWLLFEAGALSKTVDDRARVFTFLFPGLEPHNVKPPLSMFQATKAEKVDMRKMLQDLNAALGDSLKERDLSEVFEAMWPRLEESIQGMPTEQRALPPKRSSEDMLAEILDLARGLDRKLVGGVVSLEPGASLHGEIMEKMLRLSPAERAEQTYRLRDLLHPDILPPVPGLPPEKP